jgi:hypothetical protein
MPNPIPLSLRAGSYGHLLVMSLEPSQIYAAIKAFFSTRDKSGLNAPAPKAVLAAITQLPVGVFQGGTAQNAQENSTIA